MREEVLRFTAHGMTRMQLLEDIVAKADEYFEGVNYKVEEQSVSVSRISNAADELLYYEAEVVCLRVTEH